MTGERDPRDTRRSPERTDPPEEPDGLSLEKLAELAAWGAGRRAMPAWLRGRRAVAGPAASPSSKRPRSRERGA